MPSSFSAARDDERHHAVEADRREQRREQAEAGREQRDQPIGEQRFVELRLDRLHLVDRHRRIELLHLVANQAVRRRRPRPACARRTCAVPAPVGNEDLAPHALARALVERVGDDADDLDVSFVSGPPPQPEALADRALALEEVLGELRLTIATFAFSLTSIRLKSRPSRSGIFIVSK